MIETAPYSRTEETMPPVLDSLLRFYEWWDSDPDADWKIEDGTSKGPIDDILAQHGFDPASTVSEYINKVAISLSSPYSMFAAEAEEALNVALFYRLIDTEPEEKLAERIARVSRPYLFDERSGTEQDIDQRRKEAIENSYSFIGVADLINGNDVIRHAVVKVKG